MSLLLAVSLAGQDIVTAEQYFAEVSERYAQIADYEARISIRTQKTTMLGTVWYKAPKLLRIDFTQPADQVICFNGENLVVYVPEYRAVLSQSVSTSGSGGAGLATADGLRTLRRNYTVAYEKSPGPVPLEDGSPEMVVNLLLNRRTVAEGFRTIVLSVNPDSRMIRRISGVTVSNESFTFDFSGIRTNQGIPETRFVYDSPASANVYNNFLFKTEN
ncbi:MAG: outer membrane lipoprotein carrier protein LolA [Treponema sp.]|nr:outer membrane lipoprotein carrier protein LolA [Treponema sp.]